MSSCFICVTELWCRRWSWKCVIVKPGVTNNTSFKAEIEMVLVLSEWHYLSPVEQGNSELPSCVRADNFHLTLKSAHGHTYTHTHTHINTHYLLPSQPSIYLHFIGTVPALLRNTHPKFSFAPSNIISLIRVTLHDKLNKCTRIAHDWWLNYS